MRSLITLMLISPLLTSVVVRTLSWVILLGPKGVINSALLSLNLSPVSLIYNDWGVVIGLTHVFFGYMALSLMTTISKIDDNLLLAASNLGASRWVILKEIIIPMSLPGILAGCVLVFGMSASTYATPALLGGTSSKLMATEIYDLTVNYLEFREAAAVALLLFIGVATILISQRRFFADQFAETSVEEVSTSAIQHEQSAESVTGLNSEETLTTETPIQTEEENKAGSAAVS
jgi:putative spermidine/putrescine transport system permease protein